MTPRQTAAAAAADLKWLTNSAALLNRRLHHTPADAKWWGLVRLLNEEHGLSLKAAARAATAALRGNHSQVKIAVASDASGSVSTVVDLDRYQSIFLANLSRALNYETPRRRGPTKRPLTAREALSAALRYGVDIGLLASAIERTPAERLALLEANVEFAKAARGVSK